MLENNKSVGAQNHLESYKAVISHFSQEQKYVKAYYGITGGSTLER